MTLVKRAISFGLSFSMVASSAWAGVQRSPASDSKPNVEVTADNASKEQLVRSLSEVSRTLESQNETRDAKQPSKFKTAAVHTIQNLPAESLYFFIGLGAVAFWQAWFDNAQNPVGLEQHIEHQLSPMGVLGFGVFMYANNLTSTTLSTMMKNPKFMKYIPYLGMTAGFAAQSIFSHFFTDPNVLACVRQKKVTEEDMAKGVDANPCNKAMENFADMRLAPSLTSMLLSTYLAGKLEQKFKGLILKSAKPVFKVTGVDIALLLTPGKVQISSVRAAVRGLGKVAQITTFVALDAWLNRVVTFGWKNYFDGAEFYEINQRLVDKINYLKSSDWSVENNAEIEKDLEKFKKRMADWRMTNMAEVYEAHANWQQALNQLTSMYGATYGFYNAIVDEVRSEKFDLSPVNKLDLTYPLMGVKAYRLDEERYDRMMTHPKLFANYQRETIAIVAALVDPKVQTLPRHAGEAEQDLMRDILALRATLTPEQRKQLHQMGILLKSTNDDELAKGLYLLRTEFIKTRRLQENSYAEILATVLEIAGSPSPQMEPGRGYLLAYQYAPSNKDLFAELSYYRSVGMMATPLATDYLLMQMICGPDAEKAQSTIRNSLGHPSVFLPPTITSKNQPTLTECYGTTAPNSNSVQTRVYDWPVKVGDKTYRGFLSYLKNNIRPSVLGNKESSQFGVWWDKTTTKQMEAAFGEFGKRYEQIVVKMVRSFYFQHDEGGFMSKIYKTLGLLNQGPVHNGAIIALHQEERAYLSLLQEMIAPARFYDFKLEQAMQTLPKDPTLLAIHNEFDVFTQMLQRIQFKQEKGQTLVESPLTNANLEEQMEKINVMIESLKGPMGLTDDASQVQVKMSEGQKQIALFALEGLKGLANELKTFGAIANSVSWDKIRDLEGLKVEQTPQDLERLKMLKNMRPMSSGGY